MKDHATTVAITLTPGAALEFLLAEHEPRNSTTLNWRRSALAEALFDAHGMAHPLTLARRILGEQDRATLDRLRWEEVRIRLRAAALDPVLTPTEIRALHAEVDALMARCRAGSLPTEVPPPVPPTEQPMCSDRYLPLSTLVLALAHYFPVTSAYQGPCVLLGMPDPPVGATSGTLLVRVSPAEGVAVVLPEGASHTVEVALSHVRLDLADQATRTLVDLLLARIVYPQRPNSYNAVVDLVPDPSRNVSYLRVASGVFWTSQGLRSSLSWQTEVGATDSILARIRVWNQLAAGTLSP